MRRDWLLRIFVGWTLFVFGVLIKNMITDEEHNTAFRLIHSTIAVISIALAVANWPRREHTRNPSQG